MNASYMLVHAHQYVSRRDPFAYLHDGSFSYVWRLCMGCCLGQALAVSRLHTLRMQAWQMRGGQGNQR